MKSLRINVLVLFFLLLISFLLLYFFVFANNNKIVYVDSAKLLNGYKGMLEARKEFEKKHSAWQANIDSLTRDVQDAIKKYGKSISLGTDKEKQLAKELIGSKQKELYDYQNAIKQNESQEEERLNQSVFTTVDAYLLRFGKKQGYKMILIATNGNIAYADDASDITDRVVEDLNKEYAVPPK
jgi:outer membrane protein